MQPYAKSRGSCSSAVAPRKLSLGKSGPGWLGIIYSLPPKVLSIIYNKHAAAYLQEISFITGYGFRKTAPATK